MATIRRETISLVLRFRQEKIATMAIINLLKVAR